MLVNMITSYHTNQLSGNEKVEKMLDMLKKEKENLLDEVDRTIQKKKKLSDSENELLKK